ncbi:unnamed protein product [Angiostrongylus costaricensis]|uniref:Myosin motor domain-containing protein n=1 Tax=Angiostrongylus costaricensis TaxID=334426 RepID=A0A0R3PD79_ANGCS|nr:unnamed protein product [Angiostrongylus costaricensis]
MNPSIVSEERGWELLWLATGLFAPSPTLLKEEPVFQVYFPDQSSEAIEVESSTRARDFVVRIAQRLQLRKTDGFSLFIRIKEKASRLSVLAVPEAEFFFDFIRQLSDWMQVNHITKVSDLVRNHNILLRSRTSAFQENTTASSSYQVFFMRKLWMNVKPGEDTNADLIFHYPQECPKYLLGYHKIGKQEAIYLAALILKAITKDSKNAPLAQIPQLLSNLVPKDVMNLASMNETNLIPGFLEKNRDTFSADLHALIQSSRMHLLQRIFDDTDVTTRNKSVTVSAQFRKSLDQLMQQLNQTQPFFIKCIKPNDHKKALVIAQTMDCDLVLRQLRYSGMLDTIKIRRKGYPVRHDFESFVSRYRVLVDSIVIAHHIDSRSLAEHICMQMLGDGSDFQLGKTKVFLKEKDDLYLEKEYHRMIEYRTTVIQRHVKGWIARSSFRKKKEAAIVIQKHWRRYIYQKRRAQAACRGAIVRKKVTELKLTGGRRMLIEEDRRDNVKDEVEEEELVSIVALLIRPFLVQVGKLFDFLPSDSGLDYTGNDLSTSTRITSFYPVRTSRKNYDLEKYQFGKFAATYFQSQVSCSHSKKPLKSSLLIHEDKRTQLAAMAVWATILRFMGDMPDVESTSNGNDAQMDKTPVMNRLFKTLGRKPHAHVVEGTAVSEEFDTGTRTLKNSIRNKLISMTMMRKTRSSAGNSSSSSGERSSTSSYLHNVFMENSPMSSLDKLHYIIGMGILIEELRDEIYCQLCKQLSSNPSRLSAARGWILLSLCVGCFAPSPRFIKYLYCFIREHGPADAGYSAYMEERLKRTEQNGCRRQPPSYVELQANKAKQQIVLTVTLMDGSVKTLNADSATTAGELCTAVAEKVNLKDKFGFSLYIALLDKEDELASLVAQQYYVEEGPLDVNRLENQIHNYLPDFELRGKEFVKERWTQTVMYHYRRCHIWFKVTHRFYEVAKFSGRSFARREVIIAVNWMGIYVVDDQENILLEFSYPEVTRIVHYECGRPGVDIGTLQMASRDEYSFQSSSANDIKDVVTTFLNGLKQRSQSPPLSPSTQQSLTLRRREIAVSRRWRFGREPLDVPLLKKLEGRKEQCRDAVTMFVFVMKYMGDHPSRRSHLGTDLTDVIFKPAITDVRCCYTLQNLRNL